MRSTVSIVVLNWNGKRFIDNFMKSFLKQTYTKDKLELIFTDNDSSDDSVEYLRKEYGKDKRIKIVLNDKNYGYAKGNNLGIKEAIGDYVLVCNNDLELKPDLVEELVACAQRTKSSAVVPKLMYLNKPGVINNAGSRIDTRSDWPIYEIGANEKDTGQYDDDREITAFCGACVLFTRNFLQKVGMFDNKFFMYFEDGDLSWRGKRMKHKFYYAYKAIAYHVHTGSSKEGSALFNHFVGRNRLLILAKNGSLRNLAIAWAKMMKDHFLFRIKNVLLAILGKYPKKQSLREFWLSQKMLCAAALLTPYSLSKRFHILREEKI